MCKKKVLMAMAAACMLCLPGCSDSLQTEETLAVPKEEKDAGIPEEGSDAVGNQAAGSITEQVMAPTAFQTEAESGMASVKADAVVVIPDAPGIKTKKVTARVFRQEDYNVVNRVLLDGGILWDRDYEAMEESHGFTAAELEERAAWLEGEKTRAGVDGDAPYGDKEETLNEQIEACLTMAKVAPKEAVIKEIPPIVSYDEAVSDTYGNCLSGYVTSKECEYYVNLNNNLLVEDMLYTAFTVEKEPRLADWEWQVKDLSLLERHPAIIEAETAARLKEMKGEPEQIQEEAEQLIQKMGMEAYKLQGGEYCAFYGATQEDTVSLGQTGYAVHFTRVIDGIPVTYTHNSWSQDGDDAILWPDEEMSFIYTEDGLASFQWNNPYEVEELSAEYVFLLPFADIQDIFTQMVLKENQDVFNEEGDSVEIRVEEARLGYVRVDEGKSGEGTLIPAWDFFGEKVFRNKAGEEYFVKRYDYDSLLTINAMDGTVISR